MAISQKTSAQFAQDLTTAISTKNNTYDTTVGPIPDLVIQPLANVLELQNSNIYQVQQLLSLINDGSFTSSDLDDFVFNEGLVRLSGMRASVILVFTRSTIPTSDITISANFPVATQPDESTNQSVTFLTLADATMVAANAAAYFNPATQQYELQIAAKAVIGSSIGNVGSNRVTRHLRPLSVFDSVYNRDPSTGGYDIESDDDLINRYYLSLMGSSPTVVTGIEKIIRTDFPQVVDSNIVFGNNPLNIRSATDGGAVDAYIIGQAALTVTENIVFTGAEQVIPLNNQPVLSITSVNVVSAVYGTDYVLVKDTSGVAASVRASDGIKWLLSSLTIPPVGTVISVTYVYNGLIQELQDAFTTDDLNSPGRDLLFKAATQVNITLTGVIKIRTGYDVSAARTIITANLVNFINSLTLGETVEVSDLQLVVRSLPAVSNFTIVNLSVVGTTGTIDLPMGPDAYAHIVYTTDLTNQLYLTVS